MRFLEVTVLLALLCGSVPSFAQTNISGIDFNCPPLEKSAVPPTSVHSLRPSDIAVIGALGDSITTGFGVLSDIQSIYTNLTDYRGLSWSIGGDASLPYVTTLPNILRQYNSDLYGFSNGTTPTSDFVDLPNTRLNMARIGASTSAMLQQAQDLVRKIRESDSVDFDNDWKLVTMLIGANDICDNFCRNSADIGPETWLQNVSNSLDYLRDNLPRTFVNLVQISHLTTYLSRLLNSSRGDICRIYIPNIGCPCAPFGNLSIGDTFEQILVDYRQGLANLVDMYENSDTFTVVFQPYQTEIRYQEPEVIVQLAAVDCLHLSPMGHQQITIALWNNMLERVGEKTSSIVFPVTDIKCPTEEQPFLFTAQNSRNRLNGAAGSSFFYSPLVAAALVAMATVSNN